MTQHDPYRTPPGVSPAPPAPGTPQPPYAGGPVTLPPAPVGLAKATMIVAGVWVLVRTITMVSFLVAFPEGEEALDAGQDLPLGLFAVYDVLGNLLAPVMLAAYVVGCLWLYRSREFAQAAAPEFRHTHDSVWAWLGWVIPVVAFWFPLQVVRDVRAATVGRPSNKGLALWWASWWISFLTFEFWSSSNPTLVPEMVFEVLTGVATVVAAVMWFRIVREITAGQRTRLQAHPGQAALR